MDFLQRGDAELSAKTNKHWREVAEYERYTTPLLVRLQSVDWSAVIAMHAARWHRKAIDAIRAQIPDSHLCSLALSHRELIENIQKQKPNGYGWMGSYYNFNTSHYRRIQRYPLMHIHNTGTYPIRFCPPEGQPVNWGVWFRPSDLKNSGWTPEAHSWNVYKKNRDIYENILKKHDTEQRNNLNHRQYLADCLRSISQQFGEYKKKYFLRDGTMSYSEPYELAWSLNQVLGNESGALYPSDPATLGEIEAKLNHFRRRLKEFHDAEITTVATPSPEYDYNSNLGMPAPLKRMYDSMQADRLMRLQIELAENQVKASKSIVSPTKLSDDIPSSPILSPAATRMLYLKLLKHPTLARELTTYQASELLEYAKGIYWQACELAAELLNSNANYLYPDEYKGGKEFDYWLERQSTVVESQKVQALCAGQLDAMPPASQPTKRTPAGDVRRYFPKAATIHGITASDTNALHQLAVWLLHWAGQPNGKRYSLPGQLREQMDAHPDAGKFLKACRRLHNALMPLAVTEQETKNLLGKEYNPQSRNNLQAVLRRWAGWIREQAQAQRNPTGAYLTALKRIPIVEEQDTGTPRYSVPLHLLDWDGFAADIAPLRQAFDDALPELTPDQKLALRQDLGELLSIDPKRLKRQQEMFDRQEYFPANLPTDYPSLRFEVTDQSGGLSHARQWVGPMFWSGLRALLQYKQLEARAAFEKLNAILEESQSVPEPPKPNLLPLDTLTLTVAESAEVWAGLLRPGVCFTLLDLDRLLVNVGLLDDAASRAPTLDFKGSAVVGVIQALRKQRYLLMTGNTKIAEIIADRYGRDIANPNTIGRSYSRLPAAAELPYTRALAFLPLL